MGSESAERSSNQSEEQAWGVSCRNPTTNEAESGTLESLSTPVKRQGFPEGENWPKKPHSDLSGFTNKRAMTTFSSFPFKNLGSVRSAILSRFFATP